MKFGIEVDYKHAYKFSINTSYMLMLKSWWQCRVMRLCVTMFM